MKTKILTLSIALVTAASAFAQGTLNFSSRVVGILVSPVYNVEAGDASIIKTGNTASGVPAGVQTYTGGLLTGSGFTAQLWYANGLDQPEASLITAANLSTTFRTSASLAGSLAPSFQSLTGVPVAGSATLQLRVWNNLGGTVLDWASANASSNPAMAVGKSGLFNISGLTDNTSPAPPEMSGLRSFNIHSIPEPSTIALAGLGIASLLIFRRRK